jgi:predicted AAA+ superfamily ATPase
MVFSQRFSFKLKEQLRTPRKVYVYDNGVINVYKFKISPDSGWKWLVGDPTIPG